MSDEVTNSGSLSIDYATGWEPDFRTQTWAQSPLDRDAELQDPLHPSLVHALTAAAKLDEGRGVTVLGEKASDPPTSRSYREIYDAARRVAGGLAARGVRSGDRVLLVLPTSTEFLTAFFGVQLLGAIPVPAYPPGGFRIEAGLRRLSHIARHAGARICISWGPLTNLLAELAHEAAELERIVDVAELASAKPLAKITPATAEQPAFIQYTSGSTGNPKGVLLTHHNLIANIHGMGQALRITRHDVLVGWCPLYHDMGLIGTLLSAIYWRLPLVLLSPTAFLSKPVRWLKAMSDYRGTISPAPNFGYALAVRRVKPAQREGLDLSRWRVALNGAEPVTRHAVEEFQKTYAPFGFRSEAMFPVYGLAESSLAVTFPEPGTEMRYLSVDRSDLARGIATPVEHGSADAATLVSVGKAIPGHSVAVLDDDGELADERVVGRIVTTGGSVMNGYFEDPEATSACLRDDWLDTGDLGFVHEGELYIAGRAKDVIIVRGRNYYAEDIESYAEAVEGIRRGAVVAFGLYDEQAEKDLVVLVCETRETDESVLGRLREAVAEEVIEGVGFAVDEIMLVRPGTIPKTSSGKRQRRRCRQAYLDGTLGAERGGPLRTGLLVLRAQAGAVRLRTRRILQRVSGGR